MLPYFHRPDRNYTVRLPVWEHLSEQSFRRLGKTGQMRAPTGLAAGVLSNG